MVKLSILESKVQIDLNKNISLHTKSNEKIGSSEDLENYIGYYSYNFLYFFYIISYNH